MGGLLPIYTSSCYCPTPATDLRHQQHLAYVRVHKKVTERTVELQLVAHFAGVAPSNVDEELVLGSAGPCCGPWILFMGDISCWEVGKTINSIRCSATRKEMHQPGIEYGVFTVYLSRIPVCNMCVVARKRVHTHTLVRRYGSNGIFLHCIVG